MAAMSVCRNFVIHECEGAGNDLFREMTHRICSTRKNGRLQLARSPGDRHSGEFHRIQKALPT
jgi:hypothetical protein